jgi:hypothetical protein
MDDHNLFNKTKFLLQIISFNQVMSHKNLRKWRDFYNPYCNCSVADPDTDPNPDPDPPDPRVFGPLDPDPDPDPLVRGTDPDPELDPSNIKQK